MIKDDVELIEKVIHTALRYRQDVNYARNRIKDMLETKCPKCGKDTMELSCTNTECLANQITELE